MALFTASFRDAPPPALAKGLTIPSPCWTGGDCALGLATLLRLDVGVVDGDSVPNLDFRAADRGVMFPGNEEGCWSSFPGDLERTKAVCLGADKGVVG